MMIKNKTYLDILIHGLTFICIVTFDQLTKNWALNNFSDNSFFHGLLSIELYKNPGFMLGSFVHLPSLLRIVGISSVYGLLLFFYFIIQYIFWKKAKLIRLGSTILLAAITGNAIDRIINGLIIDFIQWEIGIFQGYIFNLADVFQWPGIFLIFIGLFIHEKDLWFQNNLRKKMILNPKFQFTIGLKIIFFTLMMTMVLGLFSYTFLKVVITSLPIAIQSHYTTSFLLAFSSLSIIINLLSFGASLFLSQKLIGPFFAFESYVNDLLKGKIRPFKLRERDYYKELEDLGQQLNQYFEIHKNDKKKPK